MIKFKYAKYNRNMNSYVTNISEQNVYQVRWCEVLGNVEGKTRKDRKGYQKK